MSESGQVDAYAQVKERVGSDYPCCCLAPVLRPGGCIKCGGLHPDAPTQQKDQADV
ncbi:MAG TPA: hypothetical protein VFX35_01335 [Solirubrobacterales bacterium]|nr:hypothetical protein [Solirubrobacterales bacterium]